MKRVLRMPETERKAVLDMMRGAIAISGSYAIHPSNECAEDRTGACGDEEER